MDGVPAPGWYEDPSTAGLVRWWDGQRWTAFVAHPLSVEPTRPAPPNLPLPAAVGGVGVTVAALVGSRVALDQLSRFAWPVAVYVVIGAVLGYGPMLAWCALVVRRWGGRRWSEGVGARGRWIDAAWGPVTWLACLAGQMAAALVVVALGIPFASNTEALDGAGASRGYVLALAVLAVVAAPVVEELMFRGVVQRGLSSVLPVWSAVAAQGVLFGIAHVDPTRGAGNVGLVIVLSVLGMVLGGSALLFGRLVPAMVAHGIINTVALVVALSGIAG